MERIGRRNCIQFAPIVTLVFGGFMFLSYRFFSLLCCCFILFGINNTTIAHDCHNNGVMDINNAWTRPTNNINQPIAIYLTIRNKLSLSDHITSFDSHIGQSIQLHETVEEDGILTMRMRPNLDIKDNQTITMEPGSLHLMLNGLTEPFKSKSRFDIYIYFTRSGCYVVPVTVR